MPSGSWEQETPTGLPSARQWHAMAYHAGAPAHIVLFGGYDGSLLADTHLWDGSAWSNPSPATSPLARQGHAMLAVGSNVFMFGGNDGVIDRQDTWIWDGTTWAEQSTGLEPDGRTYHGVAASPDTGYDIVLWGGNIGDTAVWLWNQTAGVWTKVEPSPTPSARYKHAMWYDPNRGTVVIFGGLRLSDDLPLDDMWEWDGTSFTQLNAQVSPTARALAHGIDHDIATGHAVSITNGLRPSGSIVTIPGVNIPDGGELVIGDGVNAPVTFEFDNDASATGEPIDISGEPTADEVKDAIIAAVNGAASLDVTAYDGGDALVVLHNDAASDQGNIDITTDVTEEGFEVSGMSGAVDDAWTWNSQGGLWVQHPSTVLVEQGAGGVAIYDPIRQVVMIHATGTQYKWVWGTLGISPYYSYPGSLQGRIIPVQVDPPDGSYVYALGSDQENLPQFMLDIGDDISVSQEILIDAATKLIRFDWLMRYSPRMPKYRKVLDAGAVSFKTEKLVDLDSERVVGGPAVGDTLAGVLVSQSIFTAEDRDQLLVISGATNPLNDTAGSRVSAVPSGQGEVQYFDRESTGSIPAGAVAVVEKANFVDANDTGVTMELYGARWRAQCYLVDGSTVHTRAELVEQLVQAIPDGVWRGSMAVHVSQFSGIATLRFQLSLDPVVS